MLRTVAGLLPPRFGTILLDGEPVDETRIGFRRAVSALLIRLLNRHQLDALHIELATDLLIRDSTGFAPSREA